MKQLSIFILFIAFSCLVNAEDKVCEEFLWAEKEYSKITPMQLDEFTQLENVTVNCMTKIVSYKKFISVETSLLAKGFEERKQRQYLNYHCNKKGVATKGWTAKDYFFDKDSKLFMILVATPEMCKNR